MSEEEKKAVIFFKHFLEDDDDVFKISNKDLRIILNLIEKQQKELNSLKEIEKSHQEENGKLRVELEQEKNKINTIKKLMSVGDITDEALFTLVQTTMAELDRLEDIEEKLDKEKYKAEALEKHQKQYLDGELITAKQGKFFEKMIKENYISKDKIKEIYNILGEYRHFSTPTNEQIEQNENAVDKAVNFIKELLEEV